MYVQHRADVEKFKRKVETELKQTQDGLEELERLKRDLEEALKRQNNLIIGNDIVMGKLLYEYLDELTIFDARFVMIQENS